jgi:hypothetical protein
MLIHNLVICELSYHDYKTEGLSQSLSYFYLYSVFISFHLLQRYKNNSANRPYCISFTVGDRPAPSDNFNEAK